MKKALALIFLALFLVASIAMVSAKTIIAGKIYDSPNFETAGPVYNATVTVTCTTDGVTLAPVYSKIDGTYSAVFEGPNELICDVEGDDVYVLAEKDGISNSGTGKVHDYSVIIGDLYLGVVNIALIPEFGVFVGALTLLGAVGVFFLVRRK